MEILPSKFRSPPPKPPRRRHSDQLAISASGTYPSSRKKHYDENKLCMKDMHAKPGNTSLGCGSLPANWTADFSTDYKSENSVFKNASYSSSAYLNKSYADMPFSSDLVACNDSLTERIMGTDCNSGPNLEWTNKNDHMYFEQVINSSIFPIKCSTKLLDPSMDEDIGNCCGNRSSSKNSATDSKDHHRRHHSDPVLSYQEQSNLKNGIQKCALRSHSFLGTPACEGHNKLCNSLTSSSAYKETQHLYEEIKTLKEINNKLWQHLCSTQSCLEETKKHSSANSCELSISDLLSSLYYLQKAKDSAMEDRMKIILEERDTAIQELEDVVQVIAKSFADDSIQEEKCSDEEIKMLLKEIEVTCNPTKLLHQQRLLLTYLYRSKELRQDHIMHELKLAVSERDNLLEKVKYLEEELKCLKLCNDVWNSDNKHWENNLLNVLCQVIQQRDVALARMNVTKNLENINCRSSMEENAVEQLSKEYEYLQRCDEVNFSAVKRNFLSSHKDMKKCDLFTVDSTSDENGLLKGEIAVLSKALEIEVEKRENAEDKCLRLERLVTVLQKKVNGQNVGIHV